MKEWEILPKIIISATFGHYFAQKQIYKLTCIGLEFVFLNI